MIRRRGCCIYHRPETSWSAIKSDFLLVNRCVLWGTSMTGQGELIYLPRIWLATTCSAASQLPFCCLRCASYCHLIFVKYSEWHKSKELRVRFWGVIGLITYIMPKTTHQIPCYNVSGVCGFMTIIQYRKRESFQQVAFNNFHVRYSKPFGTWMKLGFHWIFMIGTIENVLIIYLNYLTLSLVLLQNLSLSLAAGGVQSENHCGWRVEDSARLAWNNWHWWHYGQCSCRWLKKCWAHCLVSSRNGFKYV